MRVVKQQANKLQRSFTVSAARRWQPLLSTRINCVYVVYGGASQARGRFNGRYIRQRRGAAAAAARAGEGDGSKMRDVAVNLRTSCDTCRRRAKLHVL